MQDKTCHWASVCDELAVQSLLESHICCPYSLPTTSFGYFRRALFATVSRLLACLVNEQLVNAYYIDSSGTGGISHLRMLPRSANPADWHGCLIVSQMQHKPVLAKMPLEVAGNVFAVSFLDPEDIGVGQWLLHKDTEATSVNNVRQIMSQVGLWNCYKDTLIKMLCDELDNSADNQARAYMNRRPDPDIFTSTAIEWEQSIIEGHATHPMHRARHAVSPLKPVGSDTDFSCPNLAFVAVPRSEIRVEGALEELLTPLYSHAEAERPDLDSGQFILDYIDRSHELVLPAHPLHLPAILHMFPSVRQLPFSAPASAQVSLRTVCPEAFMSFGYAIKLPLGIKVSSALRTITPWSTFVGPRITQVIPQILHRAPVEGALLIAGEPASAVSTNPDFDIAKYLSCIVREDPEHICRPRGERVIVAAALTNYTDKGESAVIKQWSLGSQTQRRDFLKSYTDKLLDAFLPPILNHGFAFEAHPQNTLLRIDAKSGALKGFVVRDFGGVKVHRETFRLSTGVDIEMLPDACTDAKNMYEVFDLAYHTLVQCQLHRLIRALDLHYHGDGWDIVRKSFEQRVSKDHPLHHVWYQASFDFKCFISMKLGGLYRDFLYLKLPNILFYKNEAEGIVFQSTAP